MLYSLVFVQTFLLSLAIVVAALPMRLSSAVSNDRESEMVEPKYRKSWTTSRGWSDILMSGGELVPCPMTCVFFWLIVRPKALHELLKRSMRL